MRRHPGIAIGVIAVASWCMAALLPVTSIGQVIYTNSISIVSVQTYASFGGARSATAVEGLAKTSAVAPGTVRHLYVNISTALGGGGVLTVTLRKNGADTALTCAITDPGLTCNDTTHNVAVAAGDLLDWSLALTAGTIQDLIINSQF